MKTSINKLKEELKKYAQEELQDFLGYEINKNDIDGIVENAMNDIDERITEYIDIEKEN